MITANEARNAIAVKEGHKDWETARYRMGADDLDELMIKAMEYYAELSNSHKHGVSVKQPDHKTIRAAAVEYAKWQTPPEWEQERKYAAKDFLAGAQWTLSQVAGTAAKGGSAEEKVPSPKAD
jgi:hypothetical protein